MRLETKRLILRKPKRSDWKDIVDGAGDLDIARYIGRIPHPYRKKDAIWWLDRTLKKWDKKKKDDYSFVIELKSEKKVIGSTNLHKIDWISLSAATGSWINKKYWRNGYILEAKIATLDFAFNKLKLQRIESCVYKENKASNGMAKVFGYKLEGTKRKAVKAISTGKTHDENIYGLLKADWKKARPNVMKRLKKKLK